MNKLTFRRMRETRTTLRTQCALLLALDVVAWTQIDQVFLFALDNRYKALENPTRNQMIAVVVGYLRYYQRLIDKIPIVDFIEHCPFHFVDFMIHTLIYVYHLYIVHIPF